MLKPMDFKTWQIFLALPLLAACGSFNANSPEPIPPDLTARCGLNNLKVKEKSAVPDAEFNNLFTRYGPGWTGGDSTYSVELSDGRTLWIFSDTFLGTVNPDRSRPADTPLIRNSLVVQDGDTLTTLHGGTADAPTSFFAEPSATDWYWMYDATVEGDKLRVFLLRFTRTGSGQQDFVLAGNELATLSLPDLTIESIIPVSSNSGVAWGAAIMETPRYTYIYGTEDLGLEKHMHVARAPQGSVSDTASWEYKTASRWSRDPAESARLLMGVSNEYSVTKVPGGYMLVTMNTLEVFSRELVAYFSCGPAEPWGKRTVLYETPETGGNVFTYNAHAHPQFTHAGEVLISYNSNSFVFDDLFANADLYRPHFIRVRIPGAHR